MDVDEQLRTWIIGCGISPKKIGEDAGVDYSQIYKFIKGNVELRSGSFAKLCRWANLSLEPQKGSVMAPQDQATHQMRGLLDRLETIREVAEGAIELLREEQGRKA